MAVPSSRPPSGYQERLSVPLRWWALATMFASSVLLAFLVAVPPGVAFAAGGAVAAVALAVLLTYGAAEVRVADGELLAGRARVPVRWLDRPTPLGADETRRLAGVDADARAYLLLRPYVGTAVRVDVTDPRDPTPYWLVATRHPHRLAEAIQEAIASATPH